jgi:hypothetical protein
MIAPPDLLPPDTDALLAAAPFQSGAAWWDCVIAAALPAGAAPLFAVARGRAGEPAALFPLLAASGGLTGLVTPYTSLFQPLIAAGTAPEDLSGIGAALGRALRGWPSLRLDALDVDWPGLTPLMAGMRAAGWRGYRFDSFGNWHETVAGLGWDDYLAARPGPLRETIRRKLRRHAGTLSLSIAREPATAAAALPAYEAVYASSWKQPEPYPRFTPMLVQRAAESGVLRLGVLRQGGTPLAAQYWIVQHGTASLLKLAHDKTATAISPGTLLTAMMLRCLLEQETLAEFDFGRGDDPYKQAWTRQRRQRIGVMLANPRHPRGLAVLARRGAAQAAKALFRRTIPAAPMPATPHA